MEMNCPTAADGRHNMRAPTEPEDSDCRLHAAWLVQVSEVADGLPAKQVPEQGGGSTSILTGSSAADRLLRQEVHPAPPSRSRLIMMVLVGLIFAVAVAAVISKPPNLSFFESWRLPMGGPPMEPASLERLTSATPAMRNEPGTPQLIVEPSVGVPGEPAQMRLALRGRANDAVVIVRGLVPGMELSAGTAVTGDSWELSATDLPYAWIAPPQDFVGSADLIAELRLPNAQIADRQIVHVEWTRTATGPEHQHEREQISGQKEVDPVPPIAPATVQHPHDRDVITAAPPISAERSQGQLGRKEGKSARARGKPSLRSSSVNDGSPGAPPASSDNTRAVKGFWDWSR
jgi:hypothetical protein